MSHVIEEREEPKVIRRLLARELDQLAAELNDAEDLADAIRARLLEQVLTHGSVPLRAEKSRRLETEHFEFTAASSSRTEIKDKEVDAIRQACDADVFDRLFIAVTKYKLANGATELLAATLPADAPRNLRVLFARAVSYKESKPSLSVKAKQS